MKLESFARMFNYNANYPDKIFRKEIGGSFNNILDSIRIANAKRLLEETDLKVYQFSEQ
jgi:two-component system response regulator YesN